MVQKSPRTLRGIIGDALKRLAKRIDPSPTPVPKEDSQIRYSDSGLRIEMEHAQGEFRRPKLGNQPANYKKLSSMLEKISRQNHRPPEQTADVNVELIKGGLSPQETPEPDIRTTNSAFRHVSHIRHLESMAALDDWFTSHAYNAKELYRELPKLRSLLKSTEDVSEVLSIGNQYNVFKPKDAPLLKNIIENELNSSRGRIHVLPHAVLACLKIGALTKSDAHYVERIANHLYQANDYANASAVLMHGLNYEIFDEAKTRSAFEHLLKVSPRFGYSVVSQVAGNGVNCGALDKRHENSLFELSKSARVDKNGPWPLRAAELLRYSHYVGTNNEKTMPHYLAIARTALEHNMTRDLEHISDIIKTAGVKINRKPKAVKSFNRALNAVADLKNGRRYLAGLRFAAEHNLIPRPTVKTRILDFIGEIKKEEPGIPSLHLYNAVVTLHQLKLIDKNEYDAMRQKIKDVNSDPTTRKEFYDIPVVEKVAAEPKIRRRKSRLTR